MSYYDKYRHEPLPINVGRAIELLSFAFDDIRRACEARVAAGDDNDVRFDMHVGVATDLAIAMLLAERREIGPALVLASGAVRQAAELKAMSPIGAGRVGVAINALTEAEAIFRNWQRVGTT